MLKLHVLTVGSPESNRFVSNMLRSRSHWRLFAATRIGDLFVIPAAREIDVTILHDTFATAEWGACVHYMRHQWPAAVCVRIPILEGPMLDERTLSGPVRKGWFDTIEQLVVCSRRGSRCEIDWSGMTG